MDKLTTMQKLLFIFLFMLPLVGFSNTATDTITNWQVYKDGKLVFKSHVLSKDIHTITLKKSEDFKAIEIHIGNDAPIANSKHYIIFKLNGKLVHTAVKDRKPWDSGVLFLTKEELINAVGPDLNKTLTIEYSEGGKDGYVIFKLTIKA